MSRSRGIAEPLPQTKPAQLLARLKAEEVSVYLMAHAQHDFAQHLDALGFGARVGLEGDMLGQPLNCLLVVPVAGCAPHSFDRFLALGTSSALAHMVAWPLLSRQLSQPIKLLATSSMRGFPHCSYGSPVFLTRRAPGMYGVGALTSR